MNSLQISQKARLLVVVALGALLFVGAFSWYQSSRLFAAVVDAHERLHKQVTRDQEVHNHPLVAEVIVVVPSEVLADSM